MDLQRTDQWSRAYTMDKHVAGTLAPPIVLLGISQRSGTNFLYQMMSGHQDLLPCAPILEDFLVANTFRLRPFVDAVADRWILNPEIYDIAGDPRARLTRAVGEGIHRHMARLALGIGQDEDPLVKADGRRLLTKTPSVDGADAAFELFPDAHVILLVRHIGDVVDSGMRTFGWSFEYGVQHWAAGARRMLSLLERGAPTSGRLLLVRYEDLLGDKRIDTLNRLFADLGLSPGRYDPTAAEDCPVIGSSLLGADPRDRSTWNPVYNAGKSIVSERWRNWSPYRKQRAAHVAGKLLRQLGYEVPGPVPPAIVYALPNAVLDWNARVRAGLFQLYGYLPRETRIRLRERLLPERMR